MPAGIQFAAVSRNTTLKIKVVVFLGSCKVSFSWPMMHVTFSSTTKLDENSRASLYVLKNKYSQ